MGVRGAVQLCVLLSLGAAGLLPEAYCSPEHREHTFLILHEQTSKCLKVDNDQLKLDNCSDTNNATFWKWGSSHRLYNLGSQKCLGLDLSKPSDPLKLDSCDSRFMLWWKCSGGHVYGASRYGLAVKNGAVTGLLHCNDTWRLSGTSENICEVPYHVVYTTGGNSYGKPCEFPFQFTGSWYHDCINDTTEGLEWCSTSGNFDADGKRGNCLKPMKDCNGTWIQNTELQQCYQFNAQSVLRWKEAYTSCKSQGADLLSIASAEETKYIIDNADLPDFVWIGLNNLESTGGWQWSDKSPLNFVNWDKYPTAFSVLDSSSCGRLNVNTGQWDVFPCEAQLPYICKKRLNGTSSDSTDYWHYSETTCEGNWTAYNGFCYSLQQPYTWKDADLSCQKENASLISLHSLADIELVVTKFQGESEMIWSGFQSESFPNLYKWSDGTKAQFTYWDQNEPLPLFNVTPSCVSFSRMTGRWHVSNCTEKFNCICKRPGKVQNATKSDFECPGDMNWRRHGEFCYLINKTEVMFDARCNLTITNKFEQEFLNSLMREQDNTEGKYFWTSLQDSDVSGDYYWQTAHGMKDFPYSNWNLHEPAVPGGCVAMAGFESVGKWEVKNCKSFKAQSICKKGIRSAEEKEVPKPNNATCPDGWTAGSDIYCYKLFNRERIHRQRTWKEAAGICEEFGGHLVSFSHIKEMKNIRLILNQWISDKRAIWVGLNKRNLGSWEWSDDRALSSTIFEEFQEDDYFLRDCAALEISLPKQRIPWTWHIEFIHEPEYSLHPYHCDAQLEWMCQVPKGAVVKTPAWYQPGSINNVHTTLIFNGAEYWFVSDTKLNHRDAALYCALNGSELAVIDSYGVQFAIQEHLKQQLSEQKQTVSKWWVKSIDYRSQQPFILHRILGRPYNYCPFVLPSPSFSDRLQRMTCKENLPFVCKTQNFSMIETNASKPTTFAGTCPSNWTSFESKCYLKVPFMNMTFSDANDYCQKYGGMLPSILSQSDQDFIISLTSGLAQKFWIGLRLTLNSPQNSWLDGSKVNYSNFNPLLEGRFKKFDYDPLNKEKSQQCLFILNDPKSSFVGTWDFTSCADMQPVTICQKALENVTVVPAVVQENVTYEGKSYKILQKKLTWYTAVDECRSQNMELVSITDQYQLSFLSITLRQADQPLWIGLSSTDDGIHYRWQDGSVVTLNRWSDGDKGDEDCVFMAVDGTWKTESCDTELAGAVCHKPTNQTQKPRGGNIACPHKVQDTVWIPYQNNCYAFLLSHKRWTSNEGRYPCDSLDLRAFVLSLRDEDEKLFIFNQLQPYLELAKWVWLGIMYDVNEKSLRWHDKTFVKYSNWRYGRPVVTNNSFYAAMKLDGYWDIFHNPKDFELLFLQQHSIVVCKIEGGTTGDHTDPLATAIPYANSTYYILKKKRTWFEAVKECKQMDGNLVSVHDESQQLFLENIVRQDGFPLWIGLWNNGFNQQELHSNIEWSDGSAIDYKSVNLENFLPYGSCAYLDTKRTWRAKNCSEPLDGAICYRPSGVKSKSVAAHPQCPNTPGQWVHQNDFCYGFDVKIYNYSVYTIEQAKKVCQSLDSSATLLTINDQEENAFVSEYLKTDVYMTHRVWLGIHMNSGDQKSIWLDGSPIKYSNWNPEQRVNMGSCAVLVADTGTWNKVPCESGQGRVICKLPAKPSRLGFIVGFTIIIILILLIGLVIYLYKKRHPFIFSSIRYRRAEDQMESMIDYA